MSALAIRPAGIDDASTISKLGRVTFDQAFGYLFDPAVLARYLDATFDEAKIVRSLEKPHNIYSVAEMGGKPIGYFKLKRNSPAPLALEGEPIQLQKIYLLKEYTGQGIGDAMLQAILAQAGSARTMWLAVVEHNPAARRFYERHGFSPRGQIHHDFEHQRFRFDVLARAL